MKLELSLVVQGCRVGVLTGLSRTALPGGVCCMYTRCCTMPQLTHDTLHTLNNLPSITQLTLDTLRTCYIVTHHTLSLTHSFSKRVFNRLAFCVLLLGQNTRKHWKSSLNIPIDNMPLYILTYILLTAPLAQHLSKISFLYLHILLTETLVCLYVCVRRLQGLGRPDEALACVEVKVDLFESFFPFQVTERGCALSFPFNITTDPESASADAGVGETTGTDNPQEGQTKMTPFKINLKDERYRDDFSPLVDGCDCYRCRNHKRACLRHLLVTNELLAGVLLMLHNKAHYCAFFPTLRGALTSGRLDLLKKRVLQGLGWR
uniref:Queuine tRNA-ribosyltransferase accessory subunit 2 n=1 Tax=Hucho hucho TaxID=62062 RepID=A0A4W5NNY3_9TELE